MQIKINIDYCKGCNLCVTICPKNVYEEGSTPSSSGYFVPEIAQLEECIDYKKRKDTLHKCELCIMVCPDQAIKYKNE